ncbi:MAG: class I SAM-dependent methyltransferase [Chitinophagaceae bacterium]|nr:class I SAM-dependent methyltransferase [Chitinophagaceae bacterium]
MSSERQLLESEGRWWGEHQHRYNEAIKLVKPADIILDIACGTGFGTAALAEITTGQTTGGDIAEEAIKECRDNWQKKNLDFQVMDGTALPYADGHFDKIVSFETIEHTTKYREMLKEFGRTLKPGGLLILSTPNAAITSPDGKIGNPFHTQEFRLQELRSILGEVFTDVQLYGQRNCRYDKKSFKLSLGKLFEKLFLSIGIRKLPYSFRNRIMKSFFGYTLYPVPGDFLLEKDDDSIAGKCPVLFAVCKK